MIIKIVDRYVFKSIYSIFFSLFPVYIVLLITLIQKAYMVSVIIGLACIGIILIVFIYTSIMSIKKKKYKYIFIDETSLNIIDKSGDEIGLETTVLEIRNPILNVIFSPNLTACYFCTLYDCYVKFENGTYYGFDLGISDYFRIKKMNLKNVRLYKIKDYLKFPFFLF